MRPTRVEHRKPIPGILKLGFLGLSIALVLGGFLALASSGPELPPRGGVTLDPLSSAKIAFVDGDLAAAEKALRGLEGKDAKTLLARVLLEAGRAEEASRLFGDLLKEDPRSFEALRGLAATSRRLGRLDLAVLYGTRATELRKDDARAWRELGFCQRDSGDTLGAMSSIQQSLALDGGQADLSNLLTELAVGLRDPSPTLPGAPQPASRDAFRPRPVDPSSLLPQTRGPDPLQNLPRPGSRPR